MTGDVPADPSSFLPGIAGINPSTGERVDMRNNLCLIFF